MPAPHPPEFRRRAVELARELDEDGNRKHPIAQVARDLKISESCLRNWMAADEIEAGDRPGVTRSEREELVRLRRENRQLRMERDLLFSSGGLLRTGERAAPAVRFSVIAAEKAENPRLSIAAACRFFGVSTSGFYDWQRAQREPCARRRRDRELAAWIGEIHRQSRGTYGAPRVHAELRLGREIRVARKRVARLMRELELQGITRRRHSRRRGERSVPNDDLVARQFRPAGPDQLWVADITEHPTREGKVYAAVVIDAWNRQVVGHSIADHLRAELVIDALDLACWRRKPTAGQTVHHSDHGTQYTSWAFGQRLRNAGLLGSMGTVGDALDNAVAESFFASMQTELLDRRRWDSRAQLARAIFEWIEVFYNQQRRHSTLGMLDPVSYANAALTETAA
ncbi:MAG: IS3 family transposase [Acidimicrobiia bacterium]